MSSHNYKHSLMHAQQPLMTQFPVLLVASSSSGSKLAGGPSARCSHTDGAPYPGIAPPSPSVVPSAITSSSRAYRGHWAPQTFLTFFHYSSKKLNRLVYSESCDSRLQVFDARFTHWRSTIDAPISTKGAVPGAPLQAPPL